MKVVFADWLFVWCSFSKQLTVSVHILVACESVCWRKLFIVNACFGHVLVCSSVCLVEKLMVVNACFGGVLIDCMVVDLFIVTV